RRILASPAVGCRMTDLYQRLEEAKPNAGEAGLIRRHTHHGDTTRMEYVIERRGLLAAGGLF
ncbi:MAG: hypothetical protein ACE5FA_08180, partial [Dehalococcoidia bacterium]